MIGDACSTKLFLIVGWSLTRLDMKAMLDRAAARGANLFAFHAFCYSIGGLRKWDAPPSEFDQNPYWPHFSLLSAYAGRLAYALSRGRRVAPVAVLDPITSVWAHSSEPGLQQDAVAQRITADWAKLMRELTAAQRPHDNLDPLLLAEATVADGMVLLGEAQYRVVVLPSMTTLERSAWEKLEGSLRNNRWSGGRAWAAASGEIESAKQVVSRCRAAFGGMCTRRIRARPRGRRGLRAAGQMATHRPPANACRRGASTAPVPARTTARQRHETSSSSRTPVWTQACELPLRGTRSPESRGSTSNQARRERL